MAQKEQRTRNYQGALFLIDHIGTPAPGNGDNYSLLLEKRSAKSDNTHDHGHNGPRASSKEHPDRGKDKRKQPSPKLNLRKRKLENPSPADRANSPEDEIVLRSTVRRASNPSTSYNTSTEEALVTQATTNKKPKISTRPRRDVSPPIPSPITPRAEHELNVQAISGESRDSEVPRPDSSIQAGARRPQSTKEIISTFEKNNKKLYEMTRGATDRIIASIGKLDGSMSSLEENPSDRLRGLYSRCWGSNWEALRVELTMDTSFAVPEVMMSLIAGFLFDHVLNQQAYNDDIKAKLLELKGTKGRAVLRILDLDNREHELAKVAREIESEDARAVLAQDDTLIAEQLTREARKLADELWVIIEPQLHCFSRLARGFGLSSGLAENSWQEVFDEQIPRLIKAALRYRLDLLASGIDHVHTWPINDDDYAVVSMEIHGTKLKVPMKVLFTVFPGTELAVPGSKDMKAEQGTKATIRPRVGDEE